MGNYFKAGDEVYVKGTIEKIEIYKDITLYKIEFPGSPNAFLGSVLLKEDQLIEKVLKEKTC